jgi:hypothetical protein
MKTTGVYQTHNFTIVGRIRLQLRNDYKNIWCAALDHGKMIWIMESFASFSILNNQWNTFTKSASHLEAGKNIALKSDFKVKSEYVEKCESISYEGQLGPWKLFFPGFFFIQASNSNTKQTAVFIINGNDNIEYLGGAKTEVETLKLKNIIQWDEWK